MVSFLGAAGLLSFLGSAGLTSFFGSARSCSLGGRLLRLRSAVYVLRHVALHMPVRGVPVRMVAAMVPVVVPAMDAARMVLAVTLRMGMHLMLALAGVSGCCAVLMRDRRRLRLRGGSCLSACRRRRATGLLRGIRLLSGIGLVLSALGGIRGLGLGIGFYGSGSLFFSGKSAARGESHRHQAHESDN